MEWSSIVSIAPFGPQDSGSNTGWFVVSNSNQKLSFNMRIIQAYDQEMLIVIKVTVSSLLGGDK